MTFIVAGGSRFIELPIVSYLVREIRASAAITVNHTAASHLILAKVPVDQTYRVGCRENKSTWSWFARFAVFSTNLFRPRLTGHMIRSPIQWQAGNRFSEFEDDLTQAIHRIAGRVRICGCNTCAYVAQLGYSNKVVGVEGEGEIPPHISQQVGLCLA